MKKLLLIGDSIRMHYQPLVVRTLANEVAVSGPAENCQTSTDILANADEWILGQSADIVHVNCGLHDLRINPGESTHQVAIDHYARNLAEIFTLIRADGHGELIWATITPLNEQRHQDSRPSRRYAADVDLYNKVALDVARKHGARINDLHQSVVSAGANRLLGPDGVHFTQQGYRCLAAEVAAAARASLRRYA